MREALVWVQLTEPAIIELVYWPDSTPDEIFRSRPVVAEIDKAMTAHLIADQVEPGGRYGYDIYANGQNITANLEHFFKTQKLYQYRKDPAAFKIAVGSCAYISEEAYDRPGKAYGTNYRIFETIANQTPDMMLWLGDNVYLREADYFSRTGILKRYTHSRSIPELQRLLSATQHYAIWDDHDYGPNDANQTFPHKDKTLEAFKLFWGNNGYGVNDLDGITSAFQFNDIHFYLLDNRWHRTDANMATTKEEMLGEEQIEWLIQSLKYSRAPFKFVAVGSQVLSTAKVYENYANYEEEREMLFDRIAAEGIKGVVFLTGDRHHSEFNKLVHKGALIYEVTASPLTSGTHRPVDEVNENALPETFVYEHNFAMLSISGPRKDRVLKMEYINADGNVLVTREIKASEWDEE
jgi:alkaline phosphatase D